MVVSMDTAIDSRFNQYIMNAELIAGAIVHPKFTTVWIKDNKQKRIGLEFLENKILKQEQLAKNNDSASANSTDETVMSEIEDVFFQFKLSDDTSTAVDCIISTYISSTSSSLDDLHGSPLLRMSFLN